MKIISAILLFTSISIFARTHKVLEILSVPSDGRLYELSFLVNKKKEIVSLVKNRKAKLKNETDEVSTFSVAQMMGGDLVLSEDQGYKVVILNPINFNKKTGGKVELSYLYNGITGRYKSITVGFSYDKKLNRWKSTFADNPVPLKHLQMVPNTFGFITLGIKKIYLKREV